MRREHDRAAVGAEPLEHAPQLAPRLRIESRRRLVEKQQIRRAGERAGQRQPLLLPARQLAHPAVALAFELDDLQQIVDRPSAVVERSEQAERLLDGQLVGELRLLQLDAEALPQLRVVRPPAQPEHLHLARIGLQEPFEDLDRGGLAGAVRTEQSEAFAALHSQRQAVDGDDVAVAFVERVAAHGVRNSHTRHCLPGRKRRVSCDRLTSCAADGPDCLS